MKSSCVVVLVLLSTSTAICATSELIVESGSHYRVVEDGRPSPGVSGRAAQKPNRYTAVGNGINFRDAKQNWVPSLPVIQSLRAGIVCTGASYRVILNTNLNSGGVVDLETSDQRRIVLQPVGIGFYDPETGRSVLLAETRDCRAEIIDNRVVFADAFQGNHITAAIVFRYEAGHFHQDVTFTKKPSVTPEDFGMGPLSRLEMMTEILESPEPVLQTHIIRAETDEVKRAAMAEPEFVDETIRFGEMALGIGRSFQTAVAGGRSPRMGPVVTKRLLTVEGRKILIEGVEWRSAVSALKELPLQASASTRPRDRAASRREFPVVRAAKRSSFNERLALLTQHGPTLQAANAHGPNGTLPAGFVLDYDIVQSCEGFTFESGHTYLITNYVSVSGAVFEAGTVIKFAVGGELVIDSEVLTDSNEGQIVLTSKDDNSIGDTIAGSTGSPSGRYAVCALGLYYTPNMQSFGDLDIRHAETAFYVYPASLSTGGYVYECDVGIVAVGGSVTFGGDICNVDTPSAEESGGTVYLITTECEADRDADGLPDDWEFQHFGNLNQTAGGDYDSDGLTNLQEYQLGTNPTQADTDGDGMSDSAEVLIGRNPRVAGTTPDTNNTLRLRVLRPWQ